MCWLLKIKAFGSHPEGFFYVQKGRISLVLKLCKLLKINKKNKKILKKVLTNDFKTVNMILHKMRNKEENIMNTMIMNEREREENMMT